MCTVAIIAGGEARRLGGRPKGALAFGATSVIERQLAVLRSITETVFVVANDPGPYADLGVPIITDEIPGTGALGGVYTALVHATADPVLVVACDMPFIHAAFLRHLVESMGSADVAIPKTLAGYEPLCACYARRCAPRLRQQIDDRVLKVQDLLPHVRVHKVGPDEIAPHDPHGVLFSNVNTPEDYARALERLDAHRSGPVAPGRDRKV
jgi:molybdopterin-guanine dinucleotide biosynthesis protein A